MAVPTHQVVNVARPSSYGESLSKWGRRLGTLALGCSGGHPRHRGDFWTAKASNPSVAAPQGAGQPTATTALFAGFGTRYMTMTRDASHPDQGHRLGHPARHEVVLHPLGVPGRRPYAREPRLASMIARECRQLSVILRRITCCADQRRSSRTSLRALVPDPDAPVVIEDDDRILAVLRQQLLNGQALRDEITGGLLSLDGRFSANSYAALM